MAWAAAVAAIAAALGGCGGEPAAKRDGATDRLTVLYTCDCQGHLYPCDCEGGKEGGILRRAAYLSRQPRGDRILVDAGNTTAGRREWELLEFEYLLKAYERMGYDAVNLGHREAALPRERLQALRGRFPFLVCANLVDGQGRCVVEPFVVARPNPTRRIGILGVMDDGVPPSELGAGLSLIPPDTAIARHLPGLLKACDTVVLLAFADEETLVNLANLFFEIAVVVGGKVRQPSAAPLKVNESVLVFITDKGKSIGRLQVQTGGAGIRAVTNSITPLATDQPGGEAMLPILAEYEQALTNRQFHLRGPARDDAEGLRAITGRKPGGAP